MNQVSIIILLCAIISVRYAYCDTPPYPLYTYPYQYQCQDLGDFVTSPPTQQYRYYCQSCRGVYPGCKRCLKSDKLSLAIGSKTNDTKFTFIGCAACDEGMYLYPIAASSVYTPLADYTQSKLIFNTCVPDCSTADMSMVNNVEQGRCEFLGYYCMHGNANEGCKRPYLENQLTHLITRPTDGIDFTYGTPSNIQNDTFKVSVLINQISPTTIYNGIVANCLQGNKSTTCQLCKPGYILINQTTCGKRCLDGFFPDLQLGSDQMTLEKAQCSQCNSMCYTCSLGGPLNCTSCLPGYYLEIIDQDVQTGQCILKGGIDSQGNQAITQTISLFVTANRQDWKCYFIVCNNREQQQMHPNYANLLSAVKAAYTLSSQMNNQTIHIFLDPAFPHYILLSDAMNGELPISFLIAPTVNINILPMGCNINEECNVTATVNNKVGPYFKIPVPFGSLVVSNIVFDSLDSVLDYTNSTAHKTCVNTAGLNCCQVDTSIGFVRCFSVDRSKELLPLFHKYEACYHRPNNGLFEIMMNDELNIHPSNQSRTILIKNCTFRNFFYEMDSFIKVPKIYHFYYNQDYILPNVSISISLHNNTFDQLNSCGAILSNNEVFPVNSAGLTKSESTIFTNPLYFAYIKQLDQAKQDYQARRFAKNESTFNLTRDNNQISKGLKINMIGNTFKKLNFLKNGVTDSEQQRKVGYISKVSREYMQHYGLVLDIFNGGTQGSSITIAKNIFKDNLFFYRFENTMRNNNPQYDRQFIKANTNPYNFQSVLCNQQLDDPANVQDNFQQFAIYEASSKRYVQMAHLISLRNFQETDIVIADNSFYNMSMPGSLIYISDYLFRSSKIVVYQNSFDLIHGYVGTNILQIMRLGKPDYQCKGIAVWTWNEQLQKSCIKSGGLIHIEGNRFTNIIGCPDVDTSVLSISSNQLGSQFVYSQYNQLAFYQKMNLAYLTPYDTSNSMYYRKSLVDYIDTAVIIKQQIQYGEKVIEVHPYITNVTGNYYQNVTMGTNSVYEGVFVQGALNKFVNIFGVDINHENFINIGSFNIGQFQKTIYEIKVEKANDWIVLYKQSPYAGFYTDYISAGLISTNQIGRLRILGKNNFQNIWVFDRTKAMQQQQNGLILQVSQFAGRLQIGGQLDWQPKDNLNKDVTVFQDLTGFLNNDTISKYPSWLPQSWYSGNIQSSSLEYGIGSVLFNLQLDNNCFLNFTIMNVRFQRIFSRAAQNDGTELTLNPAIMSTVQSVVSSESRTILLESIEVIDCTFERGTGFFILYGDEVKINNVSVTGIGSFNILNSYPFNQLQIIPETKETIFSLFKIPLFQMASYANNIQVAGSNFRQITPRNGLPVFEFYQTFTYNVLKYNQILFSECTFENNFSLDHNDIDAVASVFQATSNKPMPAVFTINDCQFINNTSNCKYFFLRLH